MRPHRSPRRADNDQRDPQTSRNWAIVLGILIALVVILTLAWGAIAKIASWIHVFHGPLMIRKRKKSVLTYPC